MNVNELLLQLRAETAQQSNRARTLMNESESRLQTSQGQGKWNALQCMAHLNGYAAHYLPAFEKALETSKNKGRTPVNEVRSTWLGRKCIESVLVSNAKKMKTPKRHNHIDKSFDKKVIETFLQHQQRLEKILEKAAGVNLGKTKVKIEIMPLLKLHMGDFLQFFIYHQTRHLAQAERCLV